MQGEFNEFDEFDAFEELQVERAQLERELLPLIRHTLEKVANGFEWMDEFELAGRVRGVMKDMPASED